MLWCVEQAGIGRGLGTFELTARVVWWILSVSLSFLPPEDVNGEDILCVQESVKLEGLVVFNEEAERNKNKRSGLAQGRAPSTPLTEWLPPEP
jgi:hypothetical protein